MAHLSQVNFLFFADTLATVPANERVALGNQLIIRAWDMAENANAHNARRGLVTTKYDWKEFLREKCIEVRDAHQRAGKPYCNADLDTRDGLDAMEAALICVMDMARNADMEAAE